MKVSLKQTKQRVGASLTSKSSNFPSNLSGGVGVDGATFIPEVSDEGVISWTNNKGLDNPEPKNIRGPQGGKGDKGDRGDTGEKGETGR